MGLGLTQPQKLTHRVRVVPTYILYLGTIFSGTYFFPNTPHHAQHFWAWCVDNLVGDPFNGSRLGSDTILKCEFGLNSILKVSS